MKALLLIVSLGVGIFGIPLVVASLGAGNTPDLLRPDLLSDPQGFLDYLLSQYSNAITSEARSLGEELADAITAKEVVVDPEAFAWGFVKGYLAIILKFGVPLVAWTWGVKRIFRYV